MVRGYPGWAVESNFFQLGSARLDGGRRPESTLGQPEALREDTAALLSYALIASISFSTPTMLSARVRL